MGVARHQPAPYLGHDSCYLAGRLDGERIVGVFPVVQVRSRLFGSIGCSMPFVNYGGPASESEDIDAALLDAASAVASEWEVDYLEITRTRTSESGIRVPGIRSA